MTRDVSRNRPIGKRLLWFAGLWLASVTSLAIVAYAIRAVIRHG